MKNLKQDNSDSLRPEYRRSDFGNMVRGKYADAQVALPELAQLFLACIGEDAGLKFIYHSHGSNPNGHKPGDWTYECDNANQITLRYWVSEFSSIEEPVSNPTCVTTAQEKSDFHNLLVNHVQALRTRVDAL
ncbi:MAG TPA: hypothetical protein VJR02_21150 [Pyrinomonadaceae bacterium]|nr:hypothetical protein [Pyrinomonadaceae bacterium]